MKPSTAHWLSRRLTALLTPLPTALFALVLSTGCVGTRVLTPRTLPERVSPRETSVGREARDPSDVRVVIDVVDGPTPIRRITRAELVEHRLHIPQYETSSSRECVGGACATVTRTTYVGDRTISWPVLERSTEPVCERTPCTAYLPRGEQTLVAGGRSGYSDIVVQLDAPALVRHALELRQPSVNVWPLAGVAWILGAVGALVGPAIATYEESSLGADREPIGWGITGVGGGLILLGSLALLLNRDLVITPGTTASWGLEF